MTISTTQAECIGTDAPFIHLYTTNSESGVKYSSHKGSVNDPGGATTTLKVEVAFMITLRYCNIACSKSDSGEAVVICEQTR